jgi:hypothetical protein
MENNRYKPVPPEQRKKIGRPRKERIGQVVFIPADLLPAVKAMLTVYRQQQQQQQKEPPK